jgi:formylglycine-generating enzyme required for sulfatase activity
VGNYADAAWHEKFPKESWWDWEGYEDGYATTSPVGSFAPNKYGLYDMGGNVWQWCEDRYNGGATGNAVLRGAAWNSTGTPYSSARWGVPIQERREIIGFRCVLAQDEGPSQHRALK